MHLNLARKWRSQSFDYIVGQDLTVRILKNSLYLGKFFPVYLLAGQHGCGKTTTARVFAAAINCALLPDFQQDPQKIVPCGTCGSCLAMKAGKHPDFIEIDAASHTGVDNVRQLLETSTLMPQLGRKKIYLIDEAHMLSKSAFNAFLKMLEEPSDTVLFMLATTDEHKIIETVKSRCFQLFFQAVESQVLVKHLQFVAQQEAIVHDQDGLALIVKQSHGSVRDAITMLEQVFLSEQTVNKAAVLHVFGAAADDVVAKIFALITNTNTAQECAQQIKQLQLERYNPEYLWRQLLEVLHATLWACYDCKNDLYIRYATVVDHATQTYGAEPISTLFKYWCREEEVFMRTINKHIFLEFFIINAWHEIHKATPQQIQKFSPAKTVQKKESIVARENDTQNGAWENFIQSLQQLNQPLVVSIFKQARIIEQNSQAVTITFAQRLIFLKDTLEQTRTRWIPLFEQAFGAGIQLIYQFTAPEEPNTNQKKTAPEQPVPIKTVSQRPPPSAHKITGMQPLDISDKEQWPLAHALLEHFPGNIACVDEPEVQERKKQDIHEEQNQE